MTPFLLLALVAAQPPKVPLDANGRPDFQAAMNDRMAKGITPAKNANELLWKALGPTPEGGAGMPPEFFERLGIPEPPKEGDYFIDLTRFARDRLKLDPDAARKFDDSAIAAGQKPWKPAEFPQVAAWLAANEKPLAVVTEATKRPLYFNPLVTKKSDTEHVSITDALIPSVQKCRELAVALRARAMLRLGEVKPDDAWQDLLTGHRLARHIARGSILERIIGGSIEANVSNGTLAFIAHANLTTEQLRACLKDFQELPPMPSLVDRVDLSDRYFHLDGLQYVRRGDSDMTPEDRKAWESLDWAPVFECGDKCIDRIVAALRLPSRAERMAALDALAAELEAKAIRKPKLLGLLEVKRRGNDAAKTAGDLANALHVGAIRNAMDSADRAEQVQRNVVVAFALAAYHRSEGRYPVTLDVLAPRFVAAVPGDVFTGRGLVYRREGAGYLLYSLGPNGKDDGGRGHDDDPVGDDVRVRMPLKK
jgi:hypothetical protein